VNGMSIRTVLAMSVLLAGAACSADPDPTDPFDDVGIGDARPMPPNGPVSSGPPFGPSSAAIEHGIPYTFNLGHCGLQSPVDVDGGFWDPIEGVTPAGQPLDLGTDAEMINATAGVIVVIDDEARFRTASGSVIRFARHEGDMEFPACM